MTFLPAIILRRNLAASYDLVRGSKLLGERMGAQASTHSAAQAQGMTAPMRSPNSRKAA